MEIITIEKESYKSNIFVVNYDKLVNLIDQSCNNWSTTLTPMVNHVDPNNNHRTIYSKKNNKYKNPKDDPERFFKGKYGHMVQH